MTICLGFDELHDINRCYMQSGPHQVAPRATPKLVRTPKVKSNLARPVAPVIIVNAEGWLFFQRNCNMVTCQFSLLLILRLLNSYWSRKAKICENFLRTKKVSIFVKWVFLDELSLKLVLSLRNVWKMIFTIQNVRFEYYDLIKFGNTLYIIDRNFMVDLHLRRKFQVKIRLAINSWLLQNSMVRAVFIL